MRYVDNRYTQWTPMLMLPHKPQTANCKLQQQQLIPRKILGKFQPQFLIDPSFTSHLDSLAGRVGSACCCFYDIIVNVELYIYICSFTLSPSLAYSFTLHTIISLSVVVCVCVCDKRRFSQEEGPQASGTRERGSAKQEEEGFSSTHHHLIVFIYLKSINTTTTKFICLCSPRSEWYQCGERAAAAAKTAVFYRSADRYSSSSSSSLWRQSRADTNDGRGMAERSDTLESRRVAGRPAAQGR